MKKLIYITAVIIVAGVAGGIFLFNQKKQETTKREPIEKSTKENSPSDNITSETLKFEGKVLAGTNSPLIDFNKSDYEKAITTNKLIVLYFYANWCPICKKEVANALYPAFNELADDTVVGFRVNFNDNETDADETALAREHGVPYQHTKVFLKNGERILKSPEEWNKSRYLTEINKYK